jgi:hypothetical protein
VSIEMKVRLLRFVVLPLVVLGCSGGADNEASESTGSSTVSATTDASVDALEPSAATPTKSEYLARGDAICARAQVKLAPITARAQAPVPAGENRYSHAAEIWTDQNAILERFARELAGLGAPEGDRERVRQFLLTLAEGSQFGREIIAVLDRGRQPPSDVLQAYFEATLRGNALARGYGFQVCGRQG